MSILRHEIHALVDAIEAQATGAEWVDQAASPLGRRRHLELARTGVLRGVKDGRSVKVKRADVEAYLARHAVIRVDEKADEEREVRRVMLELERKCRVDALTPTRRRRNTKGAK